MLCKLCGRAFVPSMGHYCISGIGSTISKEVKTLSENEPDPFHTDEPQVPEEPDDDEPE